MSRCDNSRRYSLVNDRARGIDLLTGECFAHNARRVIIELAVAWLNEGPNWHDGIPCALIGQIARSVSTVGGCK
jgi:hypothetical protein